MKRWLATNLVDLSKVSMSELRSLPAHLLKDSLNLVLQQVEKPRFNLGTSGPPGRAD